MWLIEYTDEFEGWWNTLTEMAQSDVAAIVGLLEKCGPNLQFPYTSGIHNAQYKHIRELRVQHQGKPYRILYAFDPCRHIILLIGGNKTDHKQWYTKFVPIADALYAQHLTELEKEGAGDG